MAIIHGKFCDFISIHQELLATQILIYPFLIILRAATVTKPQVQNNG